MNRLPVICRIADTAEMFNDLAYKAGIHPNLTFVDLTMAFQYAQETPGLLPPCLCAVVVTPAESSQATTGGHHQELDSTEAGSSTGGGGAPLRNNPSDSPVLWFPQSIEHIPEVYAMLHAVLNCPAMEAFGPRSILGRLGAEAVSSTPHVRAELVRRSTDLQQAYVQAVVKGTWRLPTTTPPSEPYRYVAFVQPRGTASPSVPTRRAIFEMDRSGATRVDAAKGCGDRPVHEETVMTDTVRDRIRTIVEEQAAGGGYAVVGLVWRSS